MPDTNPTPGVTDMESAVEFLTAPEEASEEDETEAPLEAQDEEEDDESEEAEADPEGDDPDDADEETEEPDESLYTVKVNGEEFEVNLEELRSGYQMGKDYHQKTAALAEAKRQVEAERQQTEQLRGQLQAELANYARATEPQPDWAKLATELDPWEYQQKRASWEAGMAEKAQARYKAQALEQHKHQRILAENATKLLEVFPEWKDNAKFNEDRGPMLRAARELGYSEDEFVGNLDFRNIRMLKYAMAGLAAEKAKGKPLDPAKRVPKKVVKVLKPGAAKTVAGTHADKSAALQSKLRKRGDVKSAVDYLLGG